MTGETLRVLVVEDDDASFLVVEDLLLEAVGARATRAATYEAAVAALDAEPFDVVLADHGLGPRTGLELLREASERGWTAPVIILTGHGRGRLDMEALRAGAADYLVKTELSAALLGRAVRYAVERARAEAELRESRRALSTLLSNLPGMAYRCRNDRGWTLEFVSEGAAELTGHPPAELLGREFAPLMAPEDRERVWAAVQAALEGGRPYTVTYRIRTATGAEKWVMEQGRGVRGAGGGVRALEGIITDVTAQKRAEAALLESERYFRSLIEDSSEAVAVVAADGTLRYASPPMRRLTGYDPEERIGRGVFGLVDARDEGELRRLMRAVARRPGAGVTAELRVRHRDGSPRVLEVTSRNLLRDPVVQGIVLNARDVSERKEAARRLAESEQRHRSLFDYHPDAVYSLDLRGCFASVNPAAERISGFSREEVLGVPYHRLVVPEALAELNERFEMVLAGEVQHYATAITARDGRRVELRVTSLPVVVDGEIVGVYGIAEDVTAANEAERRLHLRDRAIAAVSDGMVITDAQAPDHPVVHVNPAFERLTGYPAAEALGRNCRFLQGPRTDPGAVALVRHAVAKGLPCAVEVLNHRRDGTPFWNFLSLSPVRDEGGRLTHYIGVLKDVTERRQTEEEVRGSELRHRSLIEHAHDVITVLEGDFAVAFTSPAVERVLGYRRTELAGTSVLDLAHPDDRGMLLELLDRAILHPGEPQWTEVRLRGADGRWRVLETVGTSLLHEPALMAIVLNQRDITERREAEAALEQSRMQFLQAQKMEAVGRLAGGVAHDFNNLLTAISGNADLLLMDLPPAHPSREDVEEIRRAAERASGLTRQLLAFSRRQVLQTRVLSLNDVVREMERMLARLIGEDVELATLLEEALGRVCADAGQVEQVVMNLVVNARDAMPDGGVVILETANATLDEETARQFPYVVPGRYAMLAVRDTGAGMDRETLEQAFEPFFTTKGPGKGTGLGLSTVYGIVKQSGGYVWIDSEPGRGTAVRVYLPLAEAAADEAGGGGGEGRTPFGPAARGVETVLVVEDDWAVRNLTVRVLERSGYTVLVASDGYEALRVAAAHAGPIHLLLTDLVMPRLGGVELARRLRATRPEVRVLFASGYGDGPPPEGGPEDAEVVAKPYGPHALASRVRRVLDGGSA